MVVLDVYEGQDGTFYGWLVVLGEEAGEPQELDQAALVAARQALLEQVAKVDAALANLAAR
jgi:hypothetical protein